MILKLLKQLRMKKLIYSIKVEKVMETLLEKQLINVKQNIFVFLTLMVLLIIKI